MIDTLVKDTVVMDTIYGRLRAWRRDQAREQSRPPYFILSNAHLAHLAVTCPTTMEGLAACPGLGPKKLTQYGPDLLNLLRQAAAEGLEHGVESPSAEPPSDDDLAEIAAGLRLELVRLLSRRFRGRYSAAQLEEALSRLAGAGPAPCARLSPQPATAGGGSH